MSSEAARHGPVTVGQVLARAARSLQQDETPQLTAGALLAHLLGWTRAQLLARPEQPLAPPLLAEYEGLLARAARAEPLAYLTGEREFYGLGLRVDARVLVPRPETELLVERVLRWAERGAHFARVLDAGTGSGCIALALAAQLPQAQVVGLDCSAGALAVARSNAIRLGLAERIEWVQGDLLECLGGRAFDLVCANLPYIPSGEVDRLLVSRHEPRLALDGGPDGLDLVRRLLARAPRALAAGGRLLLEIGHGQGAAALRLARAAFPGLPVQLHADLAGLERIVEIGAQEL